MLSFHAMTILKRTSLPVRHNWISFNREIAKCWYQISDGVWDLQMDNLGLFPRLSLGKFTALSNAICCWRTRRRDYPGIGPQLFFTKRYGIAQRVNDCILHADTGRTWATWSFTSLAVQTCRSRGLCPGCLNTTSLRGWSSSRRGWCTTLFARKPSSSGTWCKRLVFCYHVHIFGKWVIPVLQYLLNSVTVKYEYACVVV